MTYAVIDPVKTGLKIKAVMKQKNVSALDVKDYLSLACVQTVYRWLAGKNMPSIDNLYALSWLLEVEIDDLVAGNRQERKSPISLKETSIKYQVYHELQPMSLNLSFNDIGFICSMI